MMPRSGDVVHLTKAASVQFWHTPTLFRVIGVNESANYDGWVWIDGYELNAEGDAVERRSVFVQHAGLHAAANVPDPTTRNRRIPRQRAPRTASQPAIRKG